MKARGRSGSRLVGFDYDPATQTAKFSMYVPGTADCKRATVHAKDYDEAVRRIGETPAVLAGRHATLTFLDRTTGNTLCSAPIGLISAANTAVGVATCTFDAVAGTYTVETRVGGWYVRDSASDDVTLAVTKSNGAMSRAAGPHNSRRRRQRTRPIYICEHGSRAAI